MSNLTRFSIAASDAAGSMTIEGRHVGPTFADGSEGFDIELKGTGLAVSTRKSINPSDVEAFVAKVNQASASGVPQPAQFCSAKVSDLVMEITPKNRGCNLKVSLRHGNPNQWAVSFDMNLLLTDLVASAS